MSRLHIHVHLRDAASMPKVKTGAYVYKGFRIVVRTNGEALIDKSGFSMGSARSAEEAERKVDEMVAMGLGRDSAPMENFTDLNSWRSAILRLDPNARFTTVAGTLIALGRGGDHGELGRWKYKAKTGWAYKKANQDSATNPRRAKLEKELADLERETERLDREIDRKDDQGQPVKAERERMAKVQARKAELRKALGEVKDSGPITNPRIKQLEALIAKKEKELAATPESVIYRPSRIMLRRDIDDLKKALSDLRRTEKSFTGRDDAKDLTARRINAGQFRVDDPDAGLYIVVIANSSAEALKLARAKPLEQWKKSS